jgi:phosphohistidine phosphatase
VKVLYLMRHGHSPSAAEAGVARDALRPLSDKGLADARRMAGEILRRGGKPALILHSPLRRAVETAGEVAAGLGAGLERRVCAALDNSRPADEVVAELLEAACAHDQVVCVGHQPQVGELAALLGKTLVDFRPASVAAVELEPRPRLLWTASPD